MFSKPRRDLNAPRFIKSPLALVGALGVILGLGAVSAPAMAVDDKAAAANAIYEEVVAAPDQEQAVRALSPKEKELFVYAVTPVEERVVSVQEEPEEVNSLARAASCSDRTVRGQGVSATGLALYDFWTTGRICWSGGVSSATYLDGGGYSGALGWNYVGSSSSQGIVGGWGYAAGTHNFQFNVAGVVVQSPVGCARVVGSPGGAIFDEVGVCGIG